MISERVIAALANEEVEDIEVKIRLEQALANVVAAAEEMRQGNGFRGEYTDTQADAFDDAMEALDKALKEVE